MAKKGETIENTARFTVEKATIQISGEVDSTGWFPLAQASHLLCQSSVAVLLEAYIKEHKNI